MANNRANHPLTAYNIFYRHERVRLLRLSENGQSIKDHPFASVTVAEVHDFLEKNPPPSARAGKKRVHCKTHGAVSFRELTSIVSKSWKGLDKTSKEPFNLVAHELKLKHYQEIEDERRRKKANKKREMGNHPEASNETKRQKGSDSVTVKRKEHIVSLLPSFTARQNTISHLEQQVVYQLLSLAQQRVPVDC